MCGIVGAVGHDRCGTVLLDALKRLEYRGYDSSGILTVYDQNLICPAIIHGDKDFFAEKKVTNSSAAKTTAGKAYSKTNFAQMFGIVG